MRGVLRRRRPRPLMTAAREEVAELARDDKTHRDELDEMTASWRARLDAWD